MAWLSLHLFVTLYLCHYSCLYCTNAAKHETVMSPLLRTTKSLSVTDELLESLMRRVDEQEGRLQHLETTVSENVEALRTKDRLIEALMRRVGNMEFKTRLDKSRSIRSVPDPTADQRRPAKTAVNQLGVNGTEIDEIQNAGDHYHRARNGSWLSERAVRPHTAQHQPPQDGAAEPRKWSNRVGPAVSHTNVAFSVTLSSDMTLNAHETIVYNHVILDNTNMFNSRTGVFSVPVSGVYVFTWSCTSGRNGGGTVRTSLRIDGVSRCVTYADSPNDGDFESSTGLIVTSVNEGVTVYIRAEESGKIMNNHYAVATFSGWRLF
ncbi:uncharacterized protein LOC110443130 [Mizuhopecten yessoensis]|nr:uncharacterized protein LOC110443130 [Mizuhopecten yessoensis]